MATKTNLIPLAKVRKFPSALTGQQSSTSSTSVSISEEQNEIKKETNNAYTGSGNFGQTHPTQIDVDLSSTSSDGYITLLTSRKDNNPFHEASKKLRTNLSPADSCLSLESQMECFQERIQRLENENTKLHCNFDSLSKKQNSSVDFLSLTGEFIKFYDLENHPLIQQIQGKINSLTERNFNQEGLNSHTSKLDSQMREELEILRGENKLLRERNIKLTTQLSGAHRRIGQLEREKAQLKQQVEPTTKKAKITYPTTPPRVVPDKEKIRFIKQQNSLRRIDEIYTCCGNKCINSNFVLGSCVSKNGYVNIFVDGKVKYFIDEDDGKNNWIQLYACAKFNKGSASTKNQSLFYFEVKIMKETDKICYAGIGLCETNANIFLCNNSNKWGEFEKFSWEDNDIFGCGLVYPLRHDLTKTPYVFFTKNGSKIVDQILLTEKDVSLCPFIGILSCSVEMNFGNDLNNKPFCYNVNNI